MAALPGGKAIVDKFSNKVCWHCNRRVQPNSFRDALSVKDYRITGLCQQCQDEMYTEVEDDE